MGFWESVAAAGRAFPVRWFSPRVTYISATEVQDMLTDVSGWSPAKMYRTQPHLRTVTSFLARNTAQLGLHFFEQVSDTDRRRDRDNLAAKMLARPNPSMTSYQLKFALVVDKKLYDVAYWWIVRDRGIFRLPPAWVDRLPCGPFDEPKYRVSVPGNDPMEIPASELVVFGGYDPIDPTKGSPAIESLKATLQEQVEATAYRAAVWKRGGRVSSVIERPKDAPKWSDRAREVFREDWYAKYTGRGRLAGGTPILEDGMTLKRIDFSAKEQEWVDGVKLSLAMTASAYHVNPTMVGLLDNANFANVREFRKMLYGETLGPDLSDYEATINEQLLPKLGVEGRYCEFNIAEKLQGNFEEQAQVMQTMVGAPVMTRNEGRSRFNLPSIEGGDELITPLNVLIGGQASPTDSGSQNLNSAPAARKSLIEFRRRQMAVIASKIGAGEKWWDGERWDRELIAEGWLPAEAAAANIQLREAVEAELKANRPAGAIAAAVERLTDPKEVTG